MDQETQGCLAQVMFLGGGFAVGVAIRLIWAYCVYGDPLCAFTTCVRVLP